MTRSLACALSLALVASLQQPSPELRNVRLADGTDYSLPEIDKQTSFQVPAGTNVTGELDMEVVVGSDGSVLHLRVAKSPDPSHALDQISMDTVRQWRFRPSRNSSRTLATIALLRLTFSQDEPRVRARVTTVELKPGPQEWTPPAGVVPQTMKSVAEGFTYPMPIRQVNPTYTRDAMRAKIQGTVLMDITVTPEGTIGAARIRKSLDSVYGLDEAALTAARYWFCTPATHNGVPIPANVTIEMSFNVR